jgi:hypothetical protein
VSLRTRSSLRRERLAFEGPRQAYAQSHRAPLFKCLDCETKAQFYRSQFPRQLKQWDSCLLMPQFSSYWRSTKQIDKRMSIKEILEELPKLTPEERQEIRDFLDAEEFPETDELIKAVGRMQSFSSALARSPEQVIKVWPCPGQTTNGFFAGDSL